MFSELSKAIFALEEVFSAHLTGYKVVNHR